MTKEQVTRVFGMYIGCEVKTYSGFGTLDSISLKSGHWHVSLNSGGATVGNINDTSTPHENKKAFPKGLPPQSILQLRLTPVEEITEAHLYTIACLYNGVRAILSSDGVLQIIGKENQIVKYFIINSNDLPAFFIDQLRAWGYATKVFGFDLFEAGIAVKKQ